MDEFSMNTGKSQQPIAQSMVDGNRPHVSVIVPTFNRAQRLARLLHDLSRQDVEEIRYEILICDNASSDETRDAVARAYAPTDLVRYYLEARRGASCARNCGIAHERGEILAFIDDDVRQAADWVASLWRPFERHPEVDCIGGRTGRSFLGTPGYPHREFATHLLRWVARVATPRIDDAFFDECRIHYFVAYIRARSGASMRERAQRWNGAIDSRKAPSHAAM